MDENPLIQQLLNAINTIHDPQVSTQQRQQAQQFCEQIRESPECYNCGIYLARADKSDVSKYFGLQILEHMIRTKWYKFTDQQKSQMKKDTLEILARGTKDMLTEQTFIKEKVVTLVVEIAKRDWPQQWEDFLNNLVQISTLGDTQAELILIVFRTLPDEIVVFGDNTTTPSTSSLSEQRKKDLMAGINQGLHALFGFFFNLLEKNFTSYLSNKGPNPAVAKRAHHMVESVLKTLLSYLEWVPVDLIFDNNLHGALCQLVGEQQTRLSACECLLVIMSRKASQHDKLKLIFPFEYLDVLAGSMTATTGDFEEDYNYHKRLGQTLTFLGTNLLKSNPTIDKVPANFEKYLHVMLAFANHPSVTLSSFVQPFWQSCIQSDVVYKLSYFPSFHVPLLKMIDTKMMRVGDPEKEKNINAQYSVIDFGTSVEFAKFVGIFKANLIRLLVTFASKLPDLCMEYCVVRLQEIVVMAVPENQDMTNPVYLTFDAFSLVLGHTMSGIPQEILSKESAVSAEVEDITKQKVIGFIETILKQLLEYTPKHLMIAQNQMSCFQALTPYYAINPASLNFILSKIIPYLTFRQTSEPLTQVILSLETLSLRRKAITTLIHLASHIPLALLSYLPQLLTTAQQLSQQNLILDSERVFLVEALVLISNGMKNFEKQSAFLQSMMSSFEADWNSPEITAAIENSTTLLTYIGVLQKTREATPVFEERRKKLQNLVNTFQAVYKRVTVPTESKEIEEGGYGPHIAHGMSFSSRWPVSQHNAAVLPNVIKMIRTLHSLWEPSVRASVPEEFQPMYALDEPTIQALLGMDREFKQRNMAGDQTLRYLRNVLEACRDGCYHIIGFAATHGEEFWTMNGISDALMGSVCSYLEFIQNRHLKLLLKNFGESFVSNCPEKLRPILLEPILPPLFNSVYNHLNLSYAEINNRPNMPAASKGSETTEIVDDRILHDLANVYLDFIHSYIEVKHTYHYHEVLLPMIHTIMGCLGWPDGAVCKRGVYTATKLIPTLLDDARYHSLLGREMIYAAIRALAANRNPDNALDLIGLIKDIYMQMRTISEIPKKVLMELPNITEETIETLNKNLRANHDAKIQRSYFKTLLTEKSGINISNIRHQPTILDLPPSKFFAKVEDKHWIDKTPSLEINSLFDS